MDEFNDQPQPSDSNNDRNDRPQRERIDSFEKMKVWQEAHGLVLRIFELTPRIPEEQQEGLAMLMEKIAIDVPKSIAEGFKRRGSRNKAHYYNLAQSALEGLRYMLILGRDLKFDVDFDETNLRCEQVGRMLDGLIRSMTRGDGRGGGGGGEGRRRRGGRGGRGRGRDGGGGHRRDRDAIGDEPAPLSSGADDWDDDME
jgi:four helix bundle protein